MEIQLYKSSKFRGLTNKNKLSNINIEDNKDILTYIFNKYEKIDNILDKISKVDLNESSINKGVMVIATKDLDKTKYIWEWYSNWIKLRDNNGGSN